MTGKERGLLAFGGFVAFVILFVVVFSAAAEATPINPEENKVSYWCEPDDAGIKYEPVDTPFIVPEPPEGKTWTLLVLKAGSGDGANELISNPIVGEGYSHSTGKDNSHAILCWEEERVTTTTTSSTTTSSTSSTTSSTTTSTTTPSTTTTGPTTTTSSSTTTTVVDPTTTSSSVPDTTTTAPSSTVPPTTTTTLPTLPVTGLDIDPRIGGALVLIGTLVLLGATIIGRMRDTH